MQDFNESAPLTLSVSEIRARLEGKLSAGKPSLQPPPAELPVKSPSAHRKVATTFCQPSGSGSQERPPLAPKPRNRISTGPPLSTDEPRLNAEVCAKKAARAAEVRDRAGTSSVDSSLPTPPARSSSLFAPHVDDRRSAPCAVYVTPSSVRATAAHFDSLISDGRLGVPGIVLNDFGSTSSAPTDSQVGQRAPSTTTDTTSWSDIKNEMWSESSDDVGADITDEQRSADERSSILRDSLFEDSESAGYIRKASIFGSTQLHASAIEELKSRGFIRKNSLRKSEGHQRTRNPATNILPSDIGKIRPHSSKEGRDVTSEPLTVRESGSELPQLHPNSDADGLWRPFRLHPSRGSALSDVNVETASACGSRQSGVIGYDTGDPAEDTRLKKLHYAAAEIFTVEKKFVEQLELVAVEYPKFVAQYGKERGVDILAPSSNGQAHVVKQIAVQLLMIKEAHKVLLEKFDAKMANWNSQKPNMAECLKNNAGFLKYCLPYLKEKKRFVDELIKQLQENELLAQATAKFEELAPNKISIKQRLDIVHQNVVRYTILLESYKKYLVPGSNEAKDCEDAIAELSKVSEAVNHQICLAEMEKRLLDLYRRLEGKFNVFEANRHLLHEGELMKQSRKELQPRYLILFSDVLLICKYSRGPSLGSDSFQPDFYQLPVIGIRVKGEEHGEYETHFQLLSTKKSSMFIAKTKHERDDWVKRLNNAKKEAKKLLRDALGRRPLKVTGQLPDRIKKVSPAVLDEKVEKEVCSTEPSPTFVHVSEKYVAPWIPDRKATACMVPGCTTKFNMLNRRHHCRQCGNLICRSCVGYAPVKKGASYARDKVCPACYTNIAEKWEGVIDEAVFTPPPDGSRARFSLSGRSDEAIVSGTVFVRNKRAVESEKWGRLVRHEDGVIVLNFFDAEFDPEPCARHVLLGFELRESELEEGGRLFELHHVNQIVNTSISICFRVAHSGNAERWSHALTEGLSVLKSEEHRSIAVTDVSLL